jgi:hypothetical protein
MLFPCAIVAPAQNNVQGSRMTRGIFRESAQKSQKGNCESGETSKKLRTRAKRRIPCSWFRIGEAYSAFRGWRPIPAALLSHSILLVPGPKNSLPTTSIPIHRDDLLQGENTPDKTQSIIKPLPYVKLLSKQSGGKFCGKLPFGTLPASGSNPLQSPFLQSYAFQFPNNNSKSLLIN